MAHARYENGSEPSGDGPGSARRSADLGRGSRGRAVLGLLCAVVSASLAVAQSPAAFDAAWAAAEAAAPPERARALARASDAFLALPPGPARDVRLVQGVEATLLAGRSELALQMTDEARAAGDRSAGLLTLHLRALTALGRLPALVACARAEAGAQRAAVDAALLAGQGLLLPLADAALRRGERADGEFVFEWLAAIEPADPLRIANHALVLRHLGELGAALQAYGRARELAPQDALLANDLGLCLRAAGRREQALATFWHSLALDGAVPGGQQGDGPAITNLLHVEALQPGAVRPDPLPLAAAALRRRPDAAMLRRLVLDTCLDRLAATPVGAGSASGLGAVATDRQAR